MATSKEQKSKQSASAERSQIKNLKPEGKQAATAEINTSPPVPLLLPVVRPGSLLGVFPFEVNPWCSPGLARS